MVVTPWCFSCLRHCLNIQDDYGVLLAVCLSWLLSRSSSDHGVLKSWCPEVMVFLLQSVRSWCCGGSLAVCLIMVSWWFSCSVSDHRGGSLAVCLIMVVVLLQCV